MTEPNEKGRRYRHGTLTAYNAARCRCEHCRGAYADYRARRRSDGKDHPRNPAAACQPAGRGGGAAGTAAERVPQLVTAGWPPRPAEAGRREPDRRHLDDATLLYQAAAGRGKRLSQRKPASCASTGTGSPTRTCTPSPPASAWSPARKPGSPCTASAVQRTRQPGRAPGIRRRHSCTASVPARQPCAKAARLRGCSRPASRHFRLIKRI